MSARAKLRLGTRGSELARTQSGTVAAALSGWDSRSSSRSSRRRATRTRRARSRRSARKACSCARSSKRSSSGESRSPCTRSRICRRSRRAELTIGAVPQRVDPADLLARAPRRAGRHGRRLAAAQSRRARRHGVGAAARVARALSLATSPSSRCAATCRRACAASRKAVSTPSCSRPPASSACRPSSAWAARSPTSRAAARPGAIRAGAGSRRARRPVPARRRRVLRRSRIDHAPSRAAVTAERDALARAEGGCDVAFGAYCSLRAATHELVAMLERGGAVHARASSADPATLGAAVCGAARRGGAVVSRAMTPPRLRAAASC